MFHIWLITEQYDRSDKDKGGIEVVSLVVCMKSKRYYYEKSAPNVSYNYHLNQMPAKLYFIKYCPSKISITFDTKKYYEQHD